jgi:imidazolonepropionase-like amidohydrolase
MSFKILATGFAITAFTLARPADAQPTLQRQVRDFVRVDAPVVALTHVRVIDGTGAEAKPDQTMVLEHGKIRSIEPAASAQVPAGARVVALDGYSVIPGLVGMHDYLFYPSGHMVYTEHAYSFPRLYLAGGVTSIRTTGSLETDTDIALKNKIDEGFIPGPKIHATGPYLEGPGSPIVQNHELAGPDEAKKMVNFWADRGATSFKAYMHITRAELQAAIAAAHKRGLKVTGHLCSIGFVEAAALGIDNLEHGLEVDSEFVPGKAPDVCPERRQVTDSLLKLDLESPPVKKMIAELVKRHVAVTSTLPVFETTLPGRPAPRQVVSRPSTSPPPTARSSWASLSASAR